MPFGKPKITILFHRLGDVINEWRESIDLEHIAFPDGPCLIEKLETPITYCWSPALVPKPVDWGSNIGRLAAMAITALKSNEAQMSAAFSSGKPQITRHPPSLTLF